MSFGSYSLLHSIWLGLEMLRYFQYSENIFLIIIIFYGPKKVIALVFIPVRNTQEEKF